MKAGEQNFEALYLQKPFEFQCFKEKEFWQENLKFRMIDFLLILQDFESVNKYWIFGPIKTSSFFMSQSKVSEMHFFKIPTVSRVVYCIY